MNEMIKQDGQRDGLEISSDTGGYSRPWVPAELQEHWLAQRMRDHIVDRYGEVAIPVIEYAMVLVARFEQDQTGFAKSGLGRDLIARVTKLARMRDVGGAPVASVIIPVYGNLLYTLTAILSLLEDSSSPSLEIIVGDDLSKDDTATVLGSIGGCVRILTHERQRGFLGNCNETAKIARGRVIVLQNNDTVVMPGYLAALVDLLDREPHAGMVGAKLLNADGTLQEAGGIIWDDASGWNFGRGEDARRPEFNYVKEADYISGAAIALHTALWNELGGFDRIFTPAYYEDTDLAFRVRAAGKLVFYQPEAEVIHHEGRTHGTDINSGVKHYQVKNRRKMVARWGGTFAREHAPNAHAVFAARDRTINRPHILIIDHYVPQPDRDAGSRAISDYISMFLSRGFQVTFWPDNLYDDRTYTRQLQRKGVEVIYAPWVPAGFEGWLASAAPFLDAIIVSRPHIALRYIDLIRDGYEGPLLYFGHDLHWLRLQKEARLTASDQTLKAAMRAREEETEVLRLVDVALYPTREECEVVRKYAPATVDVVEAPLYLLTDDLLEAGIKRVRRGGAEVSRDLLFVGGFGHPPNAGGILWFVGEVMPILRARGANVRLRVVGSNAGADIQALATNDVDVIGYVSDERLAELYDSAGLAIAPLRVGGGVKGKVIEAFAKGCPVVSTSVGMQGISGDGEIALVADSAEEFAGAVIAALDDRPAAAARAAQAIAFLRTNYGFDTLVQLLAPFVPRLTAIDGDEQMRFQPVRAQR